MKYQRLVSSTTPSSLQDWLGQELEDRGIDSVYARSILSLLQQDYVDIEPHECHHARGRQLKALQKYGGPGKSFYATKSKHQKWRTREMQILLTSTYPCCNAVLPNIEKLKKKAAVDCLQSASDYVNDMEELIDEVWIRLKNIKNLKGEKEDRALRKIMDPFFIPPSSPTDEIEKYFAAFPPLNGKSEAETVVDQHKISKNAWCKRCVLKRKADIENEETHESNNAGSRSSNKCTQPIIPYSSLKTIKNVYKNGNTALEVPNQHEGNGSFSKLKLNVYKNSFNTKKTTVCKMSLDTKRCVMQSLQFPLENLSVINIYQFTVEKSHLLQCLQHNTFQNIVSTLNNGGITDTLLKFISEFNFSSDFPRNKAILHGIEENESDLSTQIHQKEIPEMDVFRTDISSIAMSTCLALGSEYDETKWSISTGLDNHFKISPLSHLWDYSENPHLDITQSLLSSLSLNDNSNTLTCSFSENESMSFKNMLNLISEVESTSSKNVTCLNENLLSYNTHNSLGIDFSLWAEENSAFHTLPGKKVQDFRKDNEFASSKMKTNPEICSMNFLNKSSQEEKIRFPDTISSNKEMVLSDEEIFYSDDDSNEIFHSDEEENLFTSFKTHFQPIKISCSISELNPEVKRTWEPNNSSDKTSLQHQHKINPENDIMLENEEMFSSCDNGSGKLLNNALFNDNVIPDTKVKTGSLSSSCEELTSFTLEKSCDKIIASEQKYQPKTSQKPRDKGTNTESLSQKLSALTEFERNENLFATNKQINSEYSDKDNLESRNRMWLFYWGDNHNFIANTWQKDNYSPVLGKQNDKMYNSEVISALSKEIKEEGDELLKGLCSISDVPSDFLKHEVSKYPENCLHTKHMDIYKQNSTFMNETNTNFDLCEETSNDQSLINQNSSKISKPFIDTSFTLDNIKTSESEDEISSKLQVYNLCRNFYETDKCLDTTIQSRFQKIHSLKKDNYLEGGGWSLASDSFSDFECENIYERASSLGELSLEKSGGFFELYQKNKRLRCTSETNDENNQTGSKFALNLLQKRTKQKYAPRKRPCCFFLQGNCTRNDCRFSHDLSTTTCRFWKEGSCFKGMTCPFLHGYISENDQEVHKNDQCLSKDDLDNSYSLESESDFPSLSSVQTEVSKGRSAAVDIIQVKGLKKNKERKMLN